MPKNVEVTCYQSYVVLLVIRAFKNLSSKVRVLLTLNLSADQSLQSYFWSNVWWLVVCRAHVSGKNMQMLVIFYFDFAIKNPSSGKTILFFAVCVRLNTCGNDRKSRKYHKPTVHNVSRPILRIIVFHYVDKSSFSGISYQLFPQIWPHSCKSFLHAHHIKICHAFDDVQEAVLLAARWVSFREIKHNLGNELKIVREDSHLILRFVLHV